MGFSSARARHFGAGLAVAATLTVAAAAPAYGAGLVSQATAQGVKADVANLLALALSSSPTSATNDGTGSNTEVDAAPAVSVLANQSFLQVGAVKEAAEANQDGSSYACAGTASPSAIIQAGAPGTSCSVTDTGTGGVTLDLGQLPGVDAALAAAGGDIKITFDAVTAHGYDSGSSAPTLADLSGNVVGLSVQLGTGPVTVIQTSNAPNTDLLGEVLGGLFPGTGTGGLSVLGTTVSGLLAPVVSLTTNYQTLDGSGQPQADGSGIYSATGLHLQLLGGGLGSVDLAKVTVGPNVPSAPSDAFSFGQLPLILSGLALLVMFGVGVRRVFRQVRGLA